MSLESDKHKDVDDHEFEFHKNAKHFVTCTVSSLLIACRRWRRCDVFDFEFVELLDVDLRCGMLGIRALFFFFVFLLASGCGNNFLIVSVHPCIIAISVLSEPSIMSRPLCRKSMASQRRRVGNVKSANGQLFL